MIISYIPKPSFYLGLFSHIVEFHLQERTFLEKLSVANSK